MVDRTEAKIFDEFIGTVKDVALEPSSLDTEIDQYHVVIKPLDVEVAGKTGMMHEWVRVPATATETSVPEGSGIDLFLRDLEACSRDVRQVKNVADAFNFMKDKTFKFVKGKIGKAFKGKEAGEHWLPKRLFESDDEVKKAIADSPNKKK